MRYSPARTATPTPPRKRISTPTAYRSASTSPSVPMTSPSRMTRATAPTFLLLTCQCTSGRTLRVLSRVPGARGGTHSLSVLEPRCGHAADGRHVMGAVAHALAADPVPARSQMGSSLGFHIILACFGIAFAAVTMTAEWIGIRRGDAAALLLARRWSKLMAVVVAVGAVSGTVLSVEVVLLWPG